MSTIDSQSDKDSPNTITAQTDDVILERLRALYNKLGRQPKISDVQECDGLTRYKIRKEYGYFHNALEQAGIEPETCSSKKRTRGELIDEIRRVAEEIGRSPSRREFDKLSETTSMPVQKRFGSWNKGLEAAGVGIRCAAVGDRQGENNPQYIDGSHITQNYGGSWESARKKAVERDGYKCRRCGVTTAEHEKETGFSLHVHHIAPFRKFDTHEEANKLSNLITLCAACHSKMEGLPIDNR